MFYNYKIIFEVINNIRYQYTRFQIASSSISAN